MSIKFSTKGQTLSALSSKITRAKIASLVIFTVEDWQKDKEACLLECLDLGPSPWIVRSSSLKEDTEYYSSAGKYISLLDIGKNNLEWAINKVILSYESDSSNNEILIQKQLKNVICSGVVFSHDPNTSAPYRIINYSDGPDTTIVTSGKGGKVWQQAAFAGTQNNYKFKDLMLLVEELLIIFEHHPLDIEFCIIKSKKKEILYLLQVRPLVLDRLPQSNIEQKQSLKQIEEWLEEHMKPHPFLYGKTTIFGVMPDWNPAEIIGIRPKPLALSLYRELITDSIWAYQRHNYGYRNLRSFPLMSSIYGLPYIDARISFNSFIPSDLDLRLAEPLVDYYLAKLIENPELHDKVEFDIVFSCYTLDLPQRIQCLSERGFKTEDQQIILDSLRRLTSNLIKPEIGLINNDFNKLNTLKERRDNLMHSDLDIMEKIFWLLEDCKRYGTLPFAGLARAAFIGMQLLKSLISVNILTVDEYHYFLSSIATVSSDLLRDRSKLDKKSFLANYGHLRPGTYNIAMPRYDEEADSYFNWQEKLHFKPKQDFVLSGLQNKKINDLLSQNNLGFDSERLISFIKNSIQMREKAKFEFTKNLSDILSLITRVGIQYGFSKEQLSYTNIATYREFTISDMNRKESLKRCIENGKSNYALTEKVSLPLLITSPCNVWGFEWNEVKPNYITHKSVTANVTNIEEKSKLAGSIVCIHTADPGYDWLFSYSIAGLVTEWGGANSHMAVRAGELGLPAIIGAGQQLFLKCSTANKLFIDCSTRIAIVIS